MNNTYKELLLDIIQLNVSFTQNNSELKAVENLSFTVNKGEIIGIVGESGSGKSVTAMTIMGLLDRKHAKTNGHVFFYKKDASQEDLLSLTETEMEKIRGQYIGIIFQEPMTSLNPVQKCGLQVAEVLQLHKKLSKKEAKKRVLELFKEVLLPGPEIIYNSYPHEISGGQKQRVMIAMAVCCNPSLIIADEPTTALDVTVQKNVLELLKNIRQKYNISILFITHDLGVVSEIADKVLVMHNGKCLEKNTVSKLFSDPQHAYTKGLLACRPQLEKRLKILPTVGTFMQESGSNHKHLSNYLEIISDKEREATHKIIYSKEPLVRISNLNKHYKTKGNFFGLKHNKFHALKNITFDIYKGETLGLVGESGCGKTTLGRTLLRLIEPSTGQIIFDNIPIHNLKNTALRKLRKDIQIIFQDPYSSFNPRHTIEQIITEPMAVHKLIKTKKERREKAIELLEKVGMDEKCLQRYPHEFSGGQRQRIVIARTLSLNPKFIICDESVSALDVSIQAQVLNLLNQLKSEFGFTYIFISHDLSVVKHMADRIIIMKNGEIIEINEADALYKNPVNTYTKELINAIPKTQIFSS